jgi:hypothetical protein
MRKRDTTYQASFVHYGGLWSGATPHFLGGCTNRKKVSVRIVLTRNYLTPLLLLKLGQLYCLAWEAIDLSIS